MMLIIRRNGGRNSGGMGRYYRGSGMLGTLARTLFSGGVKKVINSATSSAIAHKVADAVVDGATSTSKKVADAIVNEAVSAAGKASANAVNSVIDSVANKVRRKRPVVQEPQEQYYNKPVKRYKIDVDSLFDGSGIVYD